MQRFVSAIQAERGLPAWLKSGLWKRGFDRGSLHRAEGYAHAGNIEVTEVDHHPEESVICEALISGSAHSHYHTRVGLFRNLDSWKIESECACPVGLYCKHGAAILLFASAKLNPVQAELFATPSPPPPPKRLDPQLIAWLGNIDDATRAAETPARRPAAEKRFLAYCVEPNLLHQSDGWKFTLRIAQRQKDGSFRITDTTAQADPSRPPKYMTREDFIPAAFYHQRFRKLGLWNEMRLEHGGWDDLLEATEATGHLYIFRPRDGEWLPGSLGPPEQVSASWDILADGSARPVLRSPAGNRVILPTNPPRYLDLEAGTLGIIEGDLPPALLYAWTRGPKIQADQIPEVAARIKGMVPSAPPPVAVETVQLPPSPPEPYLRIVRGPFGTRYFAEDIIYGLVLFRYGEGPLLHPLSNKADPIHAEIRDGMRHLQPRDLHAERAAEARLRQLGLVPLHEIIEPHLLGLENRRAVVPEDPFPDLETVWFKLLDSPGFQQLRDDGWTIEIDPGSGLLIHDAGDFFPEIEVDPDHGIDWFRFDAHYEFEGRRLSLIPIIAHAIQRDYPPADSTDLPEFFTFPCENPDDGFIRFPARQLMEIVDQVRHLFHGSTGDGPLRIDRLAAAGVADSLEIDSSETTRSLAKLGRGLKDITSLPLTELPATVRADLRHYQLDGFRWLQFLASHGLHGILADDMGLGKTLQALAHLTAVHATKPGLPSLVIAPTSVVPNWAAEAEKFTPHLKLLTLHGKDRAEDFASIPEADIVLTSYPLLARDSAILHKQDWHTVVLDEAQYIKNPKAITAQAACKLKSAHRICLSGTPMENHLGELWSLMRFLMPGFLGDEKSFNTHIRRPIERDRSGDAQLALNRRVSPLILRRTKDQVATELPPKTELLHHIDLTKKQTDLYESVRAAMDKRVRDAIAAKGLAKSHIIVLDALLKLRQICCHPQLLNTPSAKKVTESAKLAYLTDELLPTLLEEGRRILLFSSFTSMLALIEEHLVRHDISFLKLTGQTKDRATLVKKFQTGEIPIFLISLKAGGTGLNLTAADTVIHYDPWWNPAAENQATDRAHRIGQTKPVFVHKLVCRGTIEDRILELQKHKSALVEALLSEDTTKLKIDAETLSHLLSPLA